MPEAPARDLGAASRKFSVLIADDCTNDRFLLKRAISTGAPSLDVVGEAADGEATIAYLSGQEKYADRRQFPFPDLLFLDLKMPGMDGFEVLAWLRRRHAFSQLRVIVFTALLEGAHRQRIFELGAKHAFLKPWRQEALVDVVKSVHSELLGLSLEAAAP